MPRGFLNGATPHMVDLMLLVLLERLEALLLHPNIAADAGQWPKTWEMLRQGRGLESFQELCSDPETLLGISLRPWAQQALRAWPR